MSFRQFAFGLTACFLVPWVAIVIIPFFMMHHLKPVAYNEATDGKDGLYRPQATGRLVNGSEVYAANGCYHCHSQLIRPVYAGNDLGRPDWAGLKSDEERGDTRRQSNIFDYQFEKFAQIGENRFGPDLSNVGLRVEKEYAKGSDPKVWLLNHLYNPRANPKLVTSKCPSFPFLFETKKIQGQTPANAIVVKDGEAVVPSFEADVLVDYLMSMKHDDAVPGSMNHLPPAPKGGAKAAAPAAAPKG
ncbi:cbb3-type cytochrome c oxidase subunit II [Haloferula sp. BvORR071]|uniref:cbb3-type cytochrome c oxidase subunit II n=1 Tax=Haloferula sp. BvORR071 TaxID=1396141 RepID=UPI0006964526|nr:cbb3-type cytochrome c oxidase subunit II [Haloferula sp. BvORR071]